MEIRLIKFLNIVEFVFCLHRTISSSTCTLRILRYLHVLLDLFLALTNIVACYCNMHQHDKKIATMEIFITTIHSMVLVILAVYKSKEYNHMLQYFNINHLHLKADPQYNKNLNNVFIFTFLLTLVTFVFQFGILIHNPIVITGVNFYFDYMLYLNLLVCDYRFIVEIYALFSILYMMSEQLTSIKRSVEEFEVVKKGTKSDIVCNEKLKVFDQWCVAYINVKESSKLFNNVFGLQMTIMVSSIVLSYIIFLYALTSMSVEGKVDLVGRVFYILFLSLLLFNLTLLSLAGQRIKNRAEVLKRRLSKLLINSLANEDYYKSTKELLRLVSSRPIKTEAFGSFSVDMNLLPTCVLFFTYYTIIALQFSNIV